MSTTPDIPALIQQFLKDYDAKAKDAVWEDLSQNFRAFIRHRILADDSDAIPEPDCDKIIKILDRNGKGNTKESEAVAKAMIPQGAWRRMFNELHTNKKLGALVEKVLTEADLTRKASLIDDLYEANASQKNNLTGPSGNAVGAFLAAYDPACNLSMISMTSSR